MIKRYFAKLISLLLLLVIVSCKKNPELTKTVNSGFSIEKPYVILISLDGFRYDYVDKYKPPFLSKFIENGVKATSLIPSFPSKTFPNHYTIATGMYPDKHGLVGNTFYSHKKDAIYKISNRETVEDGTFYGGIPIWVLADQQQMVSASYFFVGSEANVLKTRPTYYHQYNGSIKNEERVAEALRWLKLPEKERPHIITMYFSDIDDVGHKYSPDNSEKIKEKLLRLDADLNSLFVGVKKTGLSVNIIIVSDHGMKTVNASHLIPTESITNKNLYKTIDNGAIINLHLNDVNKVDSVFQVLKQKENHFKVYKTANTPGFEYLPKNKDWGELQLIPDENYYFSSQKGIEFKKKNKQDIFGVHGYDPINKEMHGIFYANGPAFKKSDSIQSIKNIHIYPLICKILGLEPPKDIDGKLSEIESVLKK